MKKNSVFSLSKLTSLQTVSKGSKASNETRPELLTARAVNKFTINGLAAAQLGVVDGDSVVIFDNPASTGVNDRYFIAKTAEGSGSKLSSNAHNPGAGRPQAFSYAGKWSEMVQNDVDKNDSVALGESGMVKSGFLAREATQLNKKGEQSYAYLAKYRIGYLIAPVLDENEQPYTNVEIDGVTYAAIFFLSEPVKYDVTGLKPYTGYVAPADPLAEVAKAEPVEGEEAPSEEPETESDEEPADDTSVEDVDPEEGTEEL